MTGIAEPLNDLRIALREVDVLSILTAATYDEADWRDPDPGAVDAVATLLGLIKRSATAALAAFHRLHGAIADAPPAPAGERWDYDKGRAPGEDADPPARALGEDADPPAQDADIVRRIRARCPDNRFEGGSDDELIQLFKRNKRVLNRSDEDVIAAMTHQK
jgi:hypothetical protein